MKNTVQLIKIAEDPSNIAEEQYFISTDSQTIKYTALAAGCMAVTVYFSTGGGAGVHMAMLEQETGQWTAFCGAISGKTITRVCLNCDGWGGDEDWRVKEGEGIPKSTAQLVIIEDKEKEALLIEGWKYDVASIKEWFKGKLGGIEPELRGGGTPEYTFPAAIN